MTSVNFPPCQVFVEILCSSQISEGSKDLIPFKVPILTRFLVPDNTPTGPKEVDESEQILGKR